MSTRLIVLNGGSSAGKSGIARCLQSVLADPWLALGTDTLVAALPATSDAIRFAPDGEVVVGPVVRELEAAWLTGVVEMVRAGARVIVDEVFLGGGASQQRWLQVIGELSALWVGVRCEPDMAADRETARGDRIGRMARAQAELAHRGVRYDLEVDTTHVEAMACAWAIAARLGNELLSGQ